MVVLGVLRSFVVILTNMLNYKKRNRKKTSNYGSVQIKDEGMVHQRVALRSMKIDFMFLVRASMEFCHRVENFHYSLFFENKDINGSSTI